MNNSNIYEPKAAPKKQRFLWPYTGSTKTFKLSADPDLSPEALEKFAKLFKPASFKRTSK